MFSPDVWTFAVVGTLALICGFFPTLMEARMRGGGLISAIVVVWLVIGVVAAFQRGYLKNTDQNCASLGTIAVTVLVGPLNYAGVNPKVGECHLPQPSSMPAMDIEHLIGIEAS
jgi:membrane-bound ClpP family serine protease